MATKKQKSIQIEEITEKLEKAQSVYLADFTGLDVASMTELRKRFRDACKPEEDVYVEFRVVKNTLAERAAEDAGYEKLTEYLAGPTAIAIGINDIPTAAKLLIDFANEIKEGPEDERPKIKIGIIDKKIVPQERVKDIASLPSKEVLLAQVVGGFQSPLSGFVGVLSGTLRKLVYALDAVKKQKEE